MALAVENALNSLQRRPYKREFQTRSQTWKEYTIQVRNSIHKILTYGVTAYYRGLVIVSVLNIQWDKTFTDWFYVSFFHTYEYMLEEMCLQCGEKYWGGKKRILDFIDILNVSTSRESTENV